MKNLRYLQYFYELYCYLLQVVGDNGPAVARIEVAIAATRGVWRVENDS